MFTSKLNFSASASHIEDYYELMKPRVMRLSIFTAVVGMALAPGEISVVTFFIAIFLIALGSGAAGALNMWYDSDIDCLMKRTANRPIPCGKIKANDALFFGMVLSAASSLALAFFVNWLAGAMLAFTIFFYVAIYTIGLKRTTVQNIVIGGASGALVPMVGWFCVANFSTDNLLLPLSLFAIIFLWTPPHFWALALLRKDDYAKANVPMLPNVSGESTTKRQIFYYSLAMFISSLLPFWLSDVSIVYICSAIILGAIFIWQSIKLILATTAGEVKAARQLFVYSIIYLFALFLILLGEALWQRFGIL